MNKNTIKYTENQEKEICDRYINKEKTRNICEIYNFTSPKLYSILKKHKIKLHGPSTILQDKMISELIQLLEKGKLLKEACQILQISKSGANKYLKKYNYYVKPAGRFQRKYTLNENYFNKIDTFNKAQILGLIFTDGTVSKLNKLVSIRLHINDIEYLEKIKEEIKSNKPLYIIKGKTFLSPYTKKKYLAGDTAILDMTSVTIHADCIKNGALPAKTWLNLGVPKENIIPSELRKAFILGAFEGDGCISYHAKNSSVYFQIAGAERFCLDIKNIIQNELGIEGNFRPHSTIFVIEYKRILDIIKIYHWLYDNANFWMTRKKEKFEQILDIFRNKGYNIS